MPARTKSTVKSNLAITEQHSHLSGDSIEVFSSDFKFMYVIPRSRVSHLPPPTNPRLFFCRSYEPGNPSSCQRGSTCKYVHIEDYLSTLEPTSTVHVKFVWHHQDECTYQRLPAGETLSVSAPNLRPPTDEIPSDMVLATRGALNRRSHHGLSHCAHFLFNRVCKLGDQCCFIHAIAVDPQSIPSQHVGRGSVKSRKIVPIECCSSDAATGGQQLYEHSSNVQDKSLSVMKSYTACENDDDQVEPSCHQDASSSPAFFSSAPPAMSSPADMRQQNQQQQGLASSSQRLYNHHFEDLTKPKVYYRHNPYSFNGAVTLLVSQ